ncbi:MAG: hypothetical protein D3916_06545 [Candidatus Electrothrix sp. MAN1_4]|nr:hypothetical protein [Candidatus Electrothrix sp. MAN1_4]
MQHKNNPFPLAGVLDAGAITGIVVALLYTAGWSYAYHYFSLFHLGLTELGLTKDNLFIYSLWVLTDSIPALIACFGTIGLYFLLRFVWKKKAIVDLEDPSEGDGEEPVQVVRHPIWLWVVTLVGSPLYLLLLFMFFYHLGAKEGWKDFTHQQENDFPSYPRVKVWLKGEQSALTEEWTFGCYRLLLRNKNQLYIFWADGMSAKVPTEVIPNSRVDALRVLPLYTSSEECL